MGIKWAVTNGLANYPDGIGRDLDVIVERGSLRKSIEIVIETLGEAGWIVVPHKQGWIWWVVAFFEDSDGSIQSLQIDLFEHLQWAFTRVVEGVGTDGPLIPRGPFFEDSGAAASKKFLLHALSSGAKAFVDRPGYLKMSAAELSVLPSVLRRVTGCEWPNLVEAVADLNLEKLDQELNFFRRRCYRHAFRRRCLWARFYGALQKQWVVNIFPLQGAPVLEIRSFSDVTEVRHTLVEEMKSLVFQKVKTIDQDGACRARDLRRLSCLQVVLIFENTNLPSGLQADLVIFSKDGDFMMKTDEGNEKEGGLHFSHENLRLSLVRVFQNHSNRQFQKYRFQFPNKKKILN